MCSDEHCRTLRWINGGLLLLVSAYLVYYWGIALYATADTRAEDPIVSFMDGFTSTAQGWISSGGGWWLLIGAVAVAGLFALWQWVLKPDGPDGSVQQETEADTPAEQA